MWKSGCPGHFGGSTHPKEGAECSKAVILYFYLCILFYSFHFISLFFNSQNNPKIRGETLEDLGLSQPLYIALKQWQQKLNEIADKTSETSDRSRRGKMGSELWARSVQLGVCFA